MVGSDFDREVLAKTPEKMLSELTLKDKDFLKIERKLKIDESMKS